MGSVMRIFDKNGVEIESPNLKDGYLKDERLFIARHEATPAVQEKGHYETINEYPNGGKDVEWVVDVQAIEAKEAYDEYEDILRYVPYSLSERNEMRIQELKDNLARTDYNILKVVEGQLSLSDIPEIIEMRAQWRKEINELEEKLG